MAPNLVRHFDSSSEQYRAAFDAFLRHTDQKVKARAWLECLIATRPTRDVFIDAGAGEGSTTSWIADRFKRTFAVEPNAFLAGQLAKSCPDAEVLPLPILDAEPAAPADFVLCSHVFYYLEDAEWVANLDRLASWLAPGGVLVLVMQNPRSDCMRMLRHFFTRRASLGDLLTQIEKRAISGFEAHLETVRCYVDTPDFQTAYTIAEFMVNTLPGEKALERTELESYVQQRFVRPGGNFRFSCTQDFLVIRRMDD